MADNFSLLEDAMDKLWFHKNILFSEPTWLNLDTMIERTRTTFQTPANLSSLPEENSISKSAAEYKNKQPAYKEKKPTRLNIVMGQPLFQLQPPPRSKIRSLTPSPSMSKTPQRRPCDRGRIPQKMRSYKSSSELENYELKGFMDLGFEFPRGELTPRMTSLLPGLQRIRGKETREVDEEGVRRPYLSEAWLINRHDSPLLNLQMLRKFPERTDMKRLLRFWARKVATLINQES